MTVRHFYNTVQYSTTDDMGSYREIRYSLLIALAISLQPSRCNALGLQNHTEFHEAKNLIDALYFKLHLQLQSYQARHERLKLESNEYLVRSDSTKDAMKVLKKLKGLMNHLMRKPSVCETFYADFDFAVARQILFGPSTSAPNDFTYALQVNHRDMINDDLSLANGNDLRVYFRANEGCKPTEIDRMLENIATTNTTILFKLQEDLNKTIRDGSAYYLVYGNKGAGKAKQNPENVYLFYDDFSNPNLENKWQKNWGSVSVKNGMLKLKTGATPTGDNAEISVFVKNGQEWEDIEVELDFNERSTNAAPGPFMRVQDASIRSTTAWWFEYVTGRKDCTMRPYQKNRDASWLYTRYLKEQVSAGSWHHVKYRVVGHSFSHWFDNELVHNNVKVAPEWRITKGTLGLGCHRTSSVVGCDTSYDNIKIKKYKPILPSVSLGPECKVDLTKFRVLGTSELSPAISCKQIHDILLHGGKLDNGVYWIKTAADHSVQTYCDLINGGWTLVGKVSGFVDKLYKFWLVKNQNTDALNNPALPSKVGSIDARYLATYHASTVMFSSGDSKTGIGSKWVQWQLPHGREMNTFWTHSVGFSTVSTAKMYPVTVKAWNGREQVCYQNKYGIMPLRLHGGSYPSATFNTAGNTKTNDYCMAIGVQKTGTKVDGWTQNANGYDSPQSNSDWPNTKYNHVSPYVTVWLK